eukprot:6042644-Amphidinium_carterae.1
MSSGTSPSGCRSAFLTFVFAAPSAALSVEPSALPVVVFDAVAAAGVMMAPPIVGMCVASLPLASHGVPCMASTIC